MFVRYFGYFTFVIIASWQQRSVLLHYPFRKSEGGLTQSSVTFSLSLSLTRVAFPFVCASWSVDGSERCTSFKRPTLHPSLFDSSRIGRESQLFCLDPKTHSVSPVRKHPFPFLSFFDRLFLEIGRSLSGGGRKSTYDYLCSYTLLLGSDPFSW